MARTIRLNLTQEQELAAIGKALSSDWRIRILRLCSRQKMSIADMAKELCIPPSSCAMHVKILVDAGLLDRDTLQGSRGNAQLCYRNADRIDIRLMEMVERADNIVSVEMPIGAYTDCEVHATCGIANEAGIIGMDDKEENFFLPEHLTAQIAWTSSGYLEYTFPNRLLSLPFRCRPKQVMVSMEICSETAGYKEDWKSDLTLFLNDRDCGTYRSMGDYGARRGKNNPISWVSGRTQYGKLAIFEVNESGSFVGGVRVGDTTIEELHLMEAHRILLRIGNKPDAKYVGGLNLFGRQFGDYSQDIIMNLVYEETMHRS